MKLTISSLTSGPSVSCSTKWPLWLLPSMLNLCINSHRELFQENLQSCLHTSLPSSTNSSSPCFRENLRKDLQFIKYWNTLSSHPESSNSSKPRSSETNFHILSYITRMSLRSSSPRTSWKRLRRKRQRETPLINKNLKRNKPKLSRKWLLWTSEGTNHLRDTRINSKIQRSFKTNISNMSVI